MNDRACPRRFVFVGGGLGDVARRFHLTNTYEVLAGLTEPTFVLCWCHNPAALEFFRFHPNHGNLVLVDLGHIYMDFMRGPKMDGREVNRRLFALCGLEESQQLTRTREPKPLRHFHAPDVIPSTGHIVIHPFGRGWGDWPEATCEVVRRALRAVPAEVRVFVISADYVAADGRVKKEDFRCDLPNVTVLKNLSAPAVFTLVATAARFVGNISALAQVAAYERVPSIVLHPKRCSDFHPPYNGYSKAIWNGNGVAMAYDGADPSILRELLQEFCGDPAAHLVLRERFAAVAGPPIF